MQGVTGNTRTYTGQRVLTETELTYKNNYLAQLAKYGESYPEAAQLTREAFEKSLNADPTDSIVLDLSTLRNPMKLKECPPLFFGLTELNISSTGVKKLPAKFPITLQHLNFSNTQVESIPDDLLPDGLESLNLCNAQAIRRLPTTLPQNLKILDISNTFVREISPCYLPDGLEIFKMGGTSIRTLDDGSIPDSVKVLDINNNSIYALPTKLPSSLEDFNLSGTGIEVIPDNSYENLRVLNIVGSRLKSLPDNLIKLPNPVRINFNNKNVDFADWMYETKNDLTLDAVNEDEVKMWDDAVKAKIQEEAKKNKAIYWADGGVLDLFPDQKPVGEQVTKINNLLGQYRTENGTVSVGGNVIHFAQDVYSLEDFGENPQTEWCLLRQEDNSYNLITANTLGNIMYSGSTHPFTRKVLSVDDIVRGNAIVELFSAANNDKVVNTP